MKNVLFIESGVFGGGSFTSLLKHIAVLNRKKIKPVVVFFNENQFIHLLEEKNIKVYVVNDYVFSVKYADPFFTFFNKLFMKGYWRFSVIRFLNIIHRKAVQQIERICLEEKIDCIHLNTELFRDRVGLLAGSKLKLPIYSQLRSKYQDKKIYFNPDYISFANKNVTHFLAVSEDTQNFWTQEVGADASKFIVLDDYVTSHDEINHFRKIPSQKINFLCIANMLPVKNHSFLFDSLKNILIETDSKLYLLGTGNEQFVTQLKNKAQELGISQHVEFLGYQSNIKDFIFDSDVVLLFSKSEGLPNVVLEAMNLGAIVIATNVGGIPEIIKDKENGYIVTLNNHNASEKVIQSVLDSPSEVQSRIRKKAKETIEEKYSEAVYRKKTDRLYE